MNRIYQGRVGSVQLPSLTEKATIDWKDLPNWQAALWEHHRIFQDAVNYYVLALASLADPDHSTSRLTKDLRVRVSEAWAEFPRPVAGEAHGLRKSLGRWLGLGEGASTEEAWTTVLEGNEATPRERALALALLLDRCGGEAKIQQGGRGYLPRFCDSKAKPTYDFSADAKASVSGKSRLSQVLHSDATEAELVQIADEMDLSWTVKLQPGEMFTPEESSARLVEGVEHVRRLLRDGQVVRVRAVASEFQDFEARLDRFKAIITSGEARFVVPRNRKASKDLTFATLVFKFFPCQFTGRVLSLFVKKPAATHVEAEENSLNFAACGDDPIKLARGRRGYVFRAFTALPPWNPRSPGEPTWKEFDIAAFKEALKSLNQFNQKTEERSEEENNLRGQIAIMLGGKIEGWKPRKTEANEDEPVPEPLAPEMFRLARELERDLTQDLADTVLGDAKALHFGGVKYEYREGEWQISRASLRGCNSFVEEWSRLYSEKGDATLPEELEDVVKNHQRDEKNKKSLGSVPLFLKLCEKKYWRLWQREAEDSEEAGSGGLFLDSMVVFRTKLRDLERALQPIKLTPAEPTHSRRLFMFSDLTDKVAKVAFNKVEGGLALDCAIAMRSDSGVKEQRVRLLYSAKRLLRDELEGGVESRWLQPMTKALGLEVPSAAVQERFESAASLMPDPPSVGYSSKRTGTRYLLNFPVTIEPQWLHSALGKAALWNGQFNGTREKKLHLHWPGTFKERADFTPWWKNADVVEHGFTCFSVDLGQRCAGAWALLHVTGFDPRKAGEGTRRPVRAVGCDGERTWFAEIISTGTLRLPGEDQQVIGAGGETSVEHFGKAGRNALAAEWEDGKRLAAALLADKPEAWVGGTSTEKSFPEQNDALLALANRRLTRLSSFHRWSCFDPDRPEVALRREKLVENLLGELEHWKDPVVVGWKSLVEAGEFTSFRSKAGEAFESLRLILGKHLVELANRVAPLRGRSWCWERANSAGSPGQLLDTGGPVGTQPTWLRGQRGLSFKRIEQLEELRRLFLRYNRSFDRNAGEPAKFGAVDVGRRSGEPCALLLEKIDRIKEQRVNQTAHLILAGALGVRLRAHQINADDRTARDIHGEYERIPGRAPVDFIAIENLDRYLTSQGRGPSENSRLMKWSHREIRDKIKMLAEEPFGIPVLEVAAAYSSRFCALTGKPGARCEERAALDEYLKASLEKRGQRPAKQGQPDPAVFRGFLEQFAQLEKLNLAFQNRLLAEGKVKRSCYTLFLPSLGGPLFSPVGTAGPSGGGKGPSQADINAATNIGLRAVAAPDAVEILHRVRVEREGNTFQPVRKNARERVAFPAGASIRMDGEPSAKLAASRAPNFFHKGPELQTFDNATLELLKKQVPIVSGVGLWATVNQRFPRQILELNARRLARWQEAQEGHVPM